MSEQKSTTHHIRQGITQLEIDQRVFDLYDEYCHGRIDRREFLRRAASITALGGAGLAMAQALLPRYAQAQTISFTDPRIKAQLRDLSVARRQLRTPCAATWCSRRARARSRRCWWCTRTAGSTPTSRTSRGAVAVDGFLALAPDGLFPVGGYPGNDDDGRTLQAGLDQAKLRTDLLNSARFLKAHKLSTGKLGVTGFCWGGGMVNYLAAALGSDMQAGVPYYGVAADTESVAKIKAPLLCHLAENDQRINATYPAFEAALKAAGVPYEVHVYPGTQHGFHNNSTPRYNEAAAKLSWERTIAHFRKHLA